MRKQKAAWLTAMLLFFGLYSGEGLGNEQSVYPRTVLLNGIWEFQGIPEMSLGVIDPGGWAGVDVPKMGSAEKEMHFGAYRKGFRNSVLKEGERVFVHFQGVAFACEVYLNGQLMGRHGPTLEPFEVELTTYLEAENALVVLVQDWTSGVAAKRMTQSAKGNQETPVEYVPLSQVNSTGQGERVTDEFSPGHPLEESLWHRTISPMGGNYRLFGIWDAVWLEVAGDLRVEDLRVESNVEEGKIRVTGRIILSRTPVEYAPLSQVNSTGQGLTPVPSSGATGQAQMDADDEDRKQIEVKVRIQDGEVTKCQAETKFAGGRFEVVLDTAGLEVWEPGNPKMYRLVVEVPSYNYRKEVPFGYRAIETRGHELFLNGKKVHLFTASIGSSGLTPEKLEERLEQLKGLNINAVRFHANVFPEWYYDVCDRMGMLVVAETAINGSYVIQNDYGSDAFFENAAIHWKGMVWKLRNHPSIAAYSIENESVMYSHGERAAEKFAELGKKVKEWDPTRPILFNGGDDPGGVADIVSLHYPHELPFWNRIPMDAWWLSEGNAECGVRSAELGKDKSEAEGRAPTRQVEVQVEVEKRPRTQQPNSSTAQQLNISDPLRAGCLTEKGERGMYIDSFWYHKPDFCWRWDRKKPLDLGEIGYFSGGKPHMDAILFGDWAYGNPGVVRDRTQAEVWRQSLDAGRASDVALMNPWNPPAGEEANEVLKEVLAPVRLILYPGAWKRYYGGKTVHWKGVIVNDTRETNTLGFRYSVSDEKGAQVFTGEMGPYAIGPGGREEVVIEFDLPEVNKPQNYEVQFKLATDPHGLAQMGVKTEEKGIGQTGRTTERKLKVYPFLNGKPWEKLGRVLLIDPAGKVGTLFQGLGVPFERVEKLQQLGEDAGTVIIGPAALEKLKGSGLEELRERIQNGEGLTLILEQDSYPLGFSPGLTLNDRHGTSLGFVAAPNHPVLKGAKDEDVQLWAGDGLISEKDFNLAVGGGYTPLIVGGGTGGLIYSPLIERQGIKGKTIFCQLPLIEKFWEEPVAADLLYHILDYLGKEGLNQDFVQADPPATARHERAGLPPDLKTNLEDKGIFVEAMSKVESPRKLRMVRGGDLANNLGGLSGIREWVEKGNVLWVYGLEPESTDKLKGLLKGVVCEPFPEKGGAVVVNKALPLTDGILNQFLYWTEPHGVFTYSFAKLIKPSDWALKLDKKSEGYVWQPLSSPALLMAADVGKGRIVVDTMNWAGITGIRSADYADYADNEGRGKGAEVASRITNQQITNNAPRVVGFDENEEMAIRLFSGLLTNLGVRLKVREAIQIEAENMEVKTPGQPLIRNRNHNYWAIFTNNLLGQDFEWPDRKEPGAEDCVIEVKARCRVKSDVPPKMKVILDGKEVGECFVDEPQWRLYRFRTQMKSGKHRIEVHLTINPDDAYNYRYLHIDWVKIYPQIRQ